MLDDIFDALVALVHAALGAAVVAVPLIAGCGTVPANDCKLSMRGDCQQQLFIQE